MGVFWVALSTVLGLFLSKAGGRILTALGIGIATYAGVAPLISSIVNTIIGLFGSLPETVVNVLAMIQIDSYLSIVFSAFAVKLLGGLAIRFVGK